MSELSGKLFQTCGLTAKVLSPKQLHVWLTLHVKLHCNVKKVNLHCAKSSG